MSAKALKDARDRLHFSKTVSDKQIARMRTGRIESVPDDYGIRISPLDRERRQVRLALEDRRLEKELERMCGSGYE